MLVDDGWLVVFVFLFFLFVFVIVFVLVCLLVFEMLLTIVMMTHVAWMTEARLTLRGTSCVDMRQTSRCPRATQVEAIFKPNKLSPRLCPHV